MILVGNQRGGAKELAIHLMKAENERVEIHDLRGFSSDNLLSAFNEAYAVSRATRCKQFLFSLFLNPPPQEQVTNEDFEDAISRVEAKLGLSGQPRAIVFHEKNGPHGLPLVALKRKVSCNVFLNRSRFSHAIKAAIFIWSA